jgi:23S rRNA-/tRNA-specific pseudouridylate synthase
MIKKGYVALVCGTGDIPSTIEEPLYSAQKKAPTLKVHKSGQNRITQVEVLARAEKYSLLKAFITKGFRHQIRVHLAHYGFPLCGDKKYGGVELSDLNRLFLHASSLSFVHPGKKKQIEFFCPLPKELQDCLTGIDKLFLERLW